MTHTTKTPTYVERVLATDTTGTLLRFLERDRAARELAYAASFAGTLEVEKD